MAMSITEGERLRALEARVADIRLDRGGEWHSESALLDRLIALETRNAELEQRLAAIESRSKPGPKPKVQNP